MGYDLHSLANCPALSATAQVVSLGCQPGPARSRCSCCRPWASGFGLPAIFHKVMVLALGGSNRKSHLRCGPFSPEHGRACLADGMIFSQRTSCPALAHPALQQLLWGPITCCTCWYSAVQKVAQLCCWPCLPSGMLEAAGSPLPPANLPCRARAVQELCKLGLS